jgi:hypothetical protein
MHIRDLSKLVVVGFLFSLLAACGGGGTSKDCAPTNPNCNDPEQIISVLGADGPMANAVVELFRLSDFLAQPPSPPSLLDADANLVTDLSYCVSVRMGAPLIQLPAKRLRSPR